MKERKQYCIPFSGLKLGKHRFNYEVDASFFEYYEYDEFHQAQLHVVVDMNKKNTLLELDFSVSGTVNINCDVTNEPFDLPIEGNIELVVKFGDDFNDEEMELLMLPHGSYEVDVSQYIYEMIVVSLPNKRLHPGIEDGTLKSDILDKLEELQPGETTVIKNDEDVDPRWNKLKKLLDKK